MAARDGDDLIRVTLPSRSDIGITADEHRSAERACFDRAGVFVLPGFLGPRLIERVVEAIVAARRMPRGPSCTRPHNVLMPLRWNDLVLELVLSSTERVDRLRRAIDAHDLRWISGYVSTKPRQSEALWWHQDWWCWDHPVSFQRPSPQVALLCYLTDTRRENGALRVLPGSHHRSVALHALLPEAHTMAAYELPIGHPALSDHPAQRSVEAEAGDAIVIDYRLLHGTHANLTDRDRDRLLLTFTPSWIRLPADIRGHLIQHPALPQPGATPAVAWRALLPAFDGPRRDLPLNRNAPASFVVR